MENKRRHESEHQDMLRKQAREIVSKSYKVALDKIGRENIRREMEGLKLSIPSHNEVTGAQVRLSIPTIDAMILCLAAVPVKVGMDIFSRKSYTEFCETLYAIRELLSEERDAAIKAKTNL